MAKATGNNIVSVQSTKNKVTGAISLTPMTYDTTAPTVAGATPKLVPMKVAASPNLPLLVFLVWVQVLFVCLVYGPMAAFLIESFPAKIRYTSMSLPYHIGNGVFGGLVPLIGLSVIAATGNIYAGLYYPMAIAGITFIAGSLLLKETSGNKIWEEPQQLTPSTGTHG
jgi:hypothetical protein